MSYDSELTTYASTLNKTINNIGTLGAKLEDFAEAVDTASDVVEQIDDIGDYAETAREAIDDQLTALKLAKQAGPLKTPAKIFEKVLIKVRPVVEEIEKAVAKLNGTKDRNGDGEDEEGEFLEKLEKQLDTVETVLRNTAKQLETKALEINESYKSVTDMQDALNKATFSDFDNLKSEIETQFAGRNAVTEPLSQKFNSILSNVNSILGLFSDAKFEIVQDEFGDFADIAANIDKVAEPLKVVASMLRPVEGLLDAVGAVVDLILAPIFDFFTKSLGIDDLLDDLSDEITDRLPNADFLDAMIAEAQDVLDSLRDFSTGNFGIEDWQLDIDERLYAATVGNSLLGPTGFGDNGSEILSGDGGGDILDARGGDDTIFGMGGNDIILATEGNDVVFGGGGVDMVYFGGFFQEYELAREEDSGNILVTHVRPEKGEENEGSTRLDSIEHVVFRNISFTGKELEDAIIGGSVLDGTDEDDLMFLNSSGKRNSDGYHEANGLDGNDRIFGSTGDDELNGGNGNDILLPGFGDDRANGDDGIDTYQILDGPSNSPIRINLTDGTVFGPEGSDTLSSIENLIVQSGGNHVLRGSDLANNMISADGEDIHVGRGGDDFMNTGGDDDFAITGSGRDQVLAGDGNDFIIAASAFAAGENENFDGGRGIDALSYSKDFNVIRDITNPELDASNVIREAINELTGSSGPVNIYARSGRIEKLDETGKVISVDRAIDVEQFVGSDQDDVLYGARGDLDTRYSIYGAGGDDKMYSLGASLVAGGEGDDRMIAVADANGAISGTNFDGGSGVDILDLTGIENKRWWFSLDGAISRSISAHDETFAGNMRSGGTISVRFNVEDVEDFRLGGGDDLIDHNAGGSAKRIFRTADGNDELNHRGGFATLYAGAGDDTANMMESGIVYGGDGNDFIRFDDTGTDNEAHGQKGNDTVVLARTNGMADGGDGYDTLAFDLNDTAGNERGYVEVDLRVGTAYMVEKRTAFRFENVHIEATVTGFEQVIGTEFGDSISGDVGDEKLIGRLGNDLLEGRDGADQLFGGAGNDTLLGGAGDDKLHGGEGNDRLDGGEGLDTAIYTYAAPDGLDGATQASGFGGVSVNLTDGRATGGSGADTLISIENVFGTSSHDTLIGNHENNVLSGEAGDDSLLGLVGDDILILGSGTDTADGGTEDDQIITGAGIKTIKGGDGFDKLVFGSEAGRITVNFNDQSYAGKLKSPVAVWLDDGTTDARVYKGVSLTPEDVKQANPVFANSADDLARVLPGAEDPDAQMFRIRDKQMAETSSGTFDSIEEIVGGAARVKLMLSSGTDRYDGTNSNRDLIDMSDNSGGVRYHMGTGDTTYAKAAGDVLRGIDGLVGGAGDDIFTGTGKSDILIGARGNDTLNGSKGADKLVGGVGADTLAGKDGVDVLLGGKGRDVLTGGKGLDRLLGNDGRDMLKGGAGKDVLSGGRGNDRMVGGDGADTFRFNMGDDRDTIRDFQDNRDVLNLKSWNFDDINSALSNAVNTSEGDVLFDFGNGDELLIRDMMKSALVDDIVI